MHGELATLGIKERQYILAAIEHAARRVRTTAHPSANWGIKTVLTGVRMPCMNS
ncbi:hypothetical protein [Nonomuraea jabiensis]|uniref:hypothetical protein n=1 Tax=Nonomuraea jabiensis TaxID=882448 RepID=UPI003D70CB00